MEPLATLREQLPEWTVAFTRLDPGLMGFCDTQRKTIWVDIRLSDRERRSTLMHEVIHAVRGHDRDDPADELAVQVEAASRLIPAGCLVDAFRRSVHPEDVCDILDVDIDTLRTRIRHLDPADGSHVRRVLAAAMPIINPARNLCGLGRWWVDFGQPGDPPCRDGCGHGAPRVTPAPPPARREQPRWPTSSDGTPLAARTHTASAT